jgi:CxxC-x17-CxxC domain-containing protein
MPDFKKSNFNGPRRPFNKGGAGRPSFGAPRNDGPRELYNAECNSCHKNCQVPFRPNGKKPVYCSDCFNQNDDRSEKPRFEKRDFNAPRSFGPSAPPARDSRIDDIKRQLDTMNATLERLAHTLESSNRSAELSKELRKHIPAAKPASAPVKRAVAKKSVKKATKKKKV